jgi:sec-independent protein translocase protein TatA
MNPLLAFGLPGGAEWVWIFLAVILLFGAKKLPELARGLGKSMGEFKKAKAEFDREIHDAAHSEPEKTADKPAGTVEHKNN